MEVHLITSASVSGINYHAMNSKLAHVLFGDFVKKAKFSGQTPNSKVLQMKLMTDFF